MEQLRRPVDGGAEDSTERLVTEETPNIGVRVRGAPR